MLINHIFPNSILRFGIKSLLSDYYILAFFKNFCDEITSRMWSSKKAKNSRYDVEDYLRVFFLSEIIGRSIHDTSEMLNEYYYSQKRGKRKTFVDGRKKRVVPHQTQVNDYLSKIGFKKTRNILRTCLDFQLQEALDKSIISPKVNVLIDFTEHPYYGKREDKMIKGTNRQKGTRKMRHYLGFSIYSRQTQLFAGLEHVASGQSKIPLINDFLFHLFDMGFEFDFVMMDREFYRAGLIEEIKSMGGDTLIPAKMYARVKKMIDEYLCDKGGRIRTYKFSSAPGSRHPCVQEVYLIFNAKKGHSLLDVKRALKKGELTLEDARKKIFTIMTTQKPKGKESSWASRTSRSYRKRWNIETGFSDLNRINRRWKSNHDNVRYLDMLVRLLLYNSWKMNKAMIQKAARKNSRKPDWTLNQNQDMLRNTFLSMERKLGR